MAYDVLTTPDFEKFFKKLHKKYPSLNNDLKEIISELEKDYQIGISLGNNLFKKRMAIESKNKGTSGGARIIYFFYPKKTKYISYIF